MLEEASRAPSALSFPVTRSLARLSSDACEDHQRGTELAGCLHAHESDMPARVWRHWRDSVQPASGAGAHFTRAAAALSEGSR
jgi:hypothetical protein